MIHQAVFRHFLVFRPRAAVVGVRVDRDAASRGEFAPDFDVAGVHQFDQIVHDDVHAESPTLMRRALSAYFFLMKTE